MIADDTSSVTSLDDPDRRSYRPSLVWIFHKYLKDDQDYLTREDMRQLLGGESVTPTEADEAFDRLDTDRDGRVTLDEFLAGFSASVQESEHNRGNRDRTVSVRKRFLLLFLYNTHMRILSFILSFLFLSLQWQFSRTGSRRRSFRRRPIQEDLYESESTESLPLSESIKKSLSSLSGHNRLAL